MTVPRILVLMGSGETAPAMTKVHRDLFARLDAGRPAGTRSSAVLIDTPYRFQENADRLSARIVEHFRTSLDRELHVASFRADGTDAANIDGADVHAAAAVAAIRRDPYVFSGPGSPSYALAAWRDTPIPDAIVDRLERGGVVVMASAAALTLGLLTIPVYEIYKVGEAPHWLEGLDVIGRLTGLRVAVVPHFDNAEGGDHDTRFCYLGERRLERLEAQMPGDAFVLGVDGHTALTLDLAAGDAAVDGLGSVTVRVAGRSERVATGSRLPIAELGRIATRLRAPRPGDHSFDGEGVAASEPDAPGPATTGGSDLAASGADRDVSRRVHEAEDALAGGDAHAAVAAVLELDSLLERRLRAGEDSPNLDAARLSFRALVIRVADDLAAARQPAQRIDPFVTTLLELRARARAERDWSEADYIRDRLIEAGVEVRDDVSGESSWEWYRISDSNR